MRVFSKELLNSGLLLCLFNALPALAALPPTANHGTLRMERVGGVDVLAIDGRGHPLYLRGSAIEQDAIDSTFLTPLRYAIPHGAIAGAAGRAAISPGRVTLCDDMWLHGLRCVLTEFATRHADIAEMSEFAQMGRRWQGLARGGADTGMRRRGKRRR